MRHQSVHDARAVRSGFFSDLHSAVLSSVRGADPSGRAAAARRRHPARWRPERIHADRGRREPDGGSRQYDRRVRQPAAHESLVVMWIVIGARLAIGESSQHYHH